MASAAPPLRFDTSFGPQTGRAIRVAPGLSRVTAPNAGPFTFTGTNTFLLGEERIGIVDPGPDDEAHLAALLAAIAGRPVEAIVLTHTHRDHSALAPRLKELTGAPLWFGGPHRLFRPLEPGEINPVENAADWALVPDRVLTDGEAFTLGGVGLVAIATPGHCANHMAFGVAGSDLLFTGDHVMGWNTTLVATPDGSMAAYLDSLEKLIRLPFVRYLPAHGGPIEDGPAYARALLAHRRARNGQIVRAVASGASRVNEVVRQLYPEIDASLLPAARMTVEAHVEYLAERGEIGLDRSPGGVRLSPPPGE